jgi:hypothetical protein
LKNLQTAATDLPLPFIKVVGKKKLYIGSIDDDRGKFAKKLSLNAKIVAIGFAKMMQKYNASIMPIFFMLWAWVPQTHNQFYWLIRHHHRP